MADIASKEFKQKTLNYLENKGIPPSVLQEMDEFMADVKLTPETGIITHVEYMVLKLVPELSIQQAGQ